MELRQLRCFHAVYRGGSFLRAANDLYITHQAVSKTIKSLEEELGIPLFDRSSAGVTPTRFGKLLFEETAEALERIDSAASRIQNAANPAEGRVHIGFMLGQLGERGSVKPDVMWRLRKEYPKIDLSWKVLILQEYEPQLAAGTMDFACGVLPKDAGAYYYEPFARLDWFIVLSEKHPLAQKTQLTMDDLDGQSIILPSASMEVRTIVESHCPKATFQYCSVEPYNVFEDFILSSDGLFIAMAQLAESRSNSALCAVPFQCEQLQTHIQLMYPIKRPLSPAARLVWEYLKQHRSRE